MNNTPRIKILVLVLFFFLFLIYPLGTFLRLPIPMTSLSIYLHDIVIGVLNIIAIIAYQKQLHRVLRLPLIRPLLLFIVSAFVSLLLNPLQLNTTEWFISLAYLIRFILYASLYLYTFLLAREKAGRGTILLFLLFFAGFTMASLGIFQYFLYPNLRNLKYLGWDPHHFRVFSTLLDPNFSGIIFVLTLFLGMGLLQSTSVKKSTPVFKLILAIGIILTFIAFILTYSRSSYIAFIIAVPFLFNRKAWKKLIVLYVGLMLIFFLLPRPEGEGVRLERTSTVVSRVHSYQKLFTVIRQYPLFGVGFNAYRYAQHTMGFLPEDEWLSSHAGSGSDNSFLFSWATAGIGGFVSLLWVLMRALKTRAHEPWLYATKNASLVALIIHSQFVNTFFFAWVLLWIWTILGLQEGFSEESL